MKREEKECNDSNDFCFLGSNVKRFGCWNVRSMIGKEEELVVEMKKYRLEILRVSETNVRGNRRKQIWYVIVIIVIIIR